MRKISKKVWQELGKIGEETGKELVKQTGKVVAGVITGKELVGDMKPIGQTEMEKLKTEDDQKRQEEMKELRGQGGLEPGRDVEKEMEEVRREKKEKEEEAEKEFLEKVKRQREAEEQERRVLAAEAMVVTSPGKGKKKKGSAFVRKGKGATQADMSATGEYARKKD